MDSLSHYRSLMDALATQMGLETLTLDEVGATSLLFDDRLPVHFGCDTEARALVLFSDLPAIEPANRLAVYEALLAGNLFWSGTGGATLCLDEKRGCPMIAQRFVLDHLDLQALSQHLEVFVSVAQSWLDTLVVTRPIVQPKSEPTAGTAPMAWSFGGLA